MKGSSSGLDMAESHGQESGKYLTRRVSTAGSMLAPEIAAAIMGLPMILWGIDRDGRITLSEGRALAALGLEPGQLVGQNVFDVYKGSPHALEPIRKSLKGELAYLELEVGGVTWENRYFPRWEDGEVVGLFGICLDITAQSKAESALRHAGQRWSSLVQNASDVIIIVTRDHEIGFINRSLTGKSQEPLEGRDVRDFIAQEHHGAVTEAIDSIFEGAPTARYECRSAGPIEESRWYESRLGPIVEDESVTHVLIIATDITGKRLAQKEQEALRAQIQHAQKLESLGVLAGGIAHDFNNLLVSMMGYAELAEMDLPERHPVTDHIRGIRSAAESAAGLCRQMLAYAGRPRLKKDAINLTELVAEMAQLISVSIPKNATFEHAMADNGWLLLGDRAQIKQVVLNLLTNATEALEGKAGTVTLRVRGQELDSGQLRSLRLMQDLSPGPYVVLEVEDTGCGMAQETQERLFDPFFTTKPSGHGLGMASVLGIVRGHQAGLGMSSTLGEGTTMRLLFPRFEHDEEPSIQETTEAHQHLLGEGRTLLIVDDEPTVLRVATGMAQRLGFQVLTAENGAEALEVFQQNANEISLAIVDLSMPVMGGVETLQQLAELAPRLPVLLSSGYHQEEGEFGGLAAKLLHKPYRLSELEARLSEALELDE